MTLERVNTAVKLAVVTAAQSYGQEGDKRTKPPHIYRRIIMWTWIKSRLAERSTYLTLFTVLGTVAGINVAPDLKEAIIATALSILTLVGVVTKEK